MKKSIFVTLIISAIVGVIIFVSGTFLHNKYYGVERYKYKTISTVSANESYTIIGGVIRNNGEGWHLIEDETHAPIEINDISQSSEAITVYYDTTEKINTMAITLDETMTAEGYKTGASVGVDRTIIFIYDKDGNLVNPKDYNSETGNIWIQGIFKR